MNHSVIFECLKNQRTKILLFFVLNGYGLKASFKQKDKGLLKIAVDKYINENDNCSSIASLNVFLLVIITRMRKEVIVS